MSVTLDYHFPEGTPFSILQKSPSIYSVKPHSHSSGSLTFHLCLRIKGLAAGERLDLEIHWPRRWERDDLPEGTSREQTIRQTGLPSFVVAIPETCYVSGDLRNWNRLTATQAGPDETVLVEITGTGEDMYFSTQIPYCYGQYEELIRFVQERMPSAVKLIGKSAAGFPMYAIAMNSETPGCPALYIQGYQHGTEFSGPWVIDFMIRHLLGTSDGERLRKSYDFDFVPAVDVDFLFYGIGHYQAPKGDQPWRAGNINRVWESKSWAEVKAIDAFLQRQIASGRRYVQGFDLHNGWNGKTNVGACYTSFPKDWPDAEYLQRQRDLASWMIENTNHCELEIWGHKADGLFSLYFYQLTGAIVNTIEFSRCRWLNRRTKNWEPYETRHLLDFAVDALRAVTEFHSVEKVAAIQ